MTSRARTIAGPSRVASKPTRTAQLVLRMTDGLHVTRMVGQICTWHGIDRARIGEVVRLQHGHQKMHRCPAGPLRQHRIDREAIPIEHGPRVIRTARFEIIHQQHERVVTRIQESPSGDSNVRRILVRYDPPRTYHPLHSSRGRIRRALAHPPDYLEGPSTPRRYYAKQVRQTDFLSPSCHDQSESAKTPARIALPHGGRHTQDSSGSAAGPWAAIA